MVKNQKDFKEEARKESTEEQKSEPPNQPEETSESQEGRKFYATKFGAKYHFDSNCKGFSDNPNFEKKPCPKCKARTAGILNLSEGSGVLVQHKVQVHWDLKFGVSTITSKIALFTEQRERGKTERQ